MSLRVALICGQQGVSLLPLLPGVLPGHVLRAFLSPAAWRAAPAPTAGAGTGPDGAFVPIAGMGALDAALAAFRPDVILVMTYLGKLPPELARHARYGMVNMHPSLLPRYRGAAPIFHAIRDGAAQSGLTYHYITADFDAGPVIARFPVAIRGQDCAQSLWLKIIRKLLATLPHLLETIGSWSETAQPQDAARATPAPAPGAAMRRLDARRTAEENLRIVRACTTLGGAVLEDHPLGSCRVIAAACDPPGTQPEAAAAQAYPYLQTRDGRLYLTLVQPMPAAAVPA